MCMIDDAEPSEFYSERRPVAKKNHTCDECGRTILPGEKYYSSSGKHEGYFCYSKMCAHCEIGANLLITHCGGFVWEGVLDDLVEHIHESLPWSRTAAKIVVAARRKWQRFDNSGLMTLPHAQETAATPSPHTC